MIVEIIIRMPLSVFVSGLLPEVVELFRATCTFVWWVARHRGYRRRAG